MFGRHKHPNDADARRAAASEALHKSVQEYYELQDLKPDVEATVRGHLTLQQENHFAERMWRAYRGEDSQ